MEKALDTILNQGVLGAVCIVFMAGIFNLVKYIMKMHTERLKDKDAIIQRLSDNELKIAQVISAFSDIKPAMEEIRELLRKYYTSKAGL
jgi:hypothetical protein